MDLEALYGFELGRENGTPNTYRPSEWSRKRRGRLSNGRREFDRHSGYGLFGPRSKECRRRDLWGILTKGQTRYEEKTETEANGFVMEEGMTSNWTEKPEYEEKSENDEEMASNWTEKDESTMTLREYEALPAKGKLLQAL